MSTRSCEVSLNTIECEHLPVLDDEGSRETPAVRTRCFSCGQKACKVCSRVQSYVRYGRKRLCNDCVGDYQT